MRYLVLILSFLLAGCVASAPCPAPPQPRKPQCPFGHPIIKFPAGKTVGAAPVVIQRDQYTLAYDPIKRVPRWVCETLSANELQGSAKRKTSYPLDPLVPRRYHSTSSVYTNSGFDRGHLLPASNQLWNQAYSDQTFYMSNIVPMPRNFNRGVWKQFEQWIRSWVQQRGDAYVITGTVFVEPLGWIKDEVAVPSHYYKILVAKRGTKSYDAIGFLFDRVSEYAPPYDWRMQVVSIDLIESMANVDLMPMLPDSKEEALERAGANFDLWEMTEKR